MKKLYQIIQSYLGMKPSDKACGNYADMHLKMEKEINELFEKEILLFSHLDFLEKALNYYWHNANDNLKRKDLGDIERQNYEIQLSKCKLIMQQMNLI